MEAYRVVFLRVSILKYLYKNLYIKLIISLVKSLYKKGIFRIDHLPQLFDMSSYCHVSNMLKIFIIFLLNVHFKVSYLLSFEMYLCYNGYKYGVNHDDKY